MGAFDIVLRYVPAPQVCRSRFVPVAQSRENVRRHMESMRHLCGRLRVGTSRFETQLCVLRIVVCVNEIMQDTWMVRLSGIHLFEQLCGLPLLLEPLGSFRNSAQDGQSIKQLRFVIRIFGVGSSHGVAVVLVSRWFRSGTSVLI